MTASAFDWLQPTPAPQAVQGPLARDMGDVSLFALAVFAALFATQGRLFGVAVL